MKQSFLDFLNEQKANQMGSKMIYEAFSEKNMDKVLELIENVLNKHINGLVPLVGYVDTIIDGKECISKQFLILDKKDPYKSGCFQFNWVKNENSSEVYSIDFFKDASDVIWQGKAKATLSIQTLGTSIVAFLPVIWTVIDNGYKISKAELKSAQQSIFKDKNIKESILPVGEITFTLYEGLSSQLASDIFKVRVNDEINEEMSEEVKQFKKKKRAEAMDAYGHRNDSEEAKEKNKKLWGEYNAIIAAIKSGAETLNDLQAALKTSGSKVEVVLDKTLQEQEAELEQRKAPEQVFKEMSKYVKMVIAGVQPSLIICGAPGVGKTFRVKQQLRAAGYVEDENMHTIKGKCTTRALYVALHDFRKKGQIMLIDDADGLVGPNAPEETINILKAALDSTADDEGRLVTYNIAGKLLDNDGIELPKRFYYNGGVIVLTNWRAGKLDTALKGRSFIQDINFTTTEILEVIKSLLPKIDPQKYSMTAKLKAYDFLYELNEQGTDMELSLRTFGICAKLYQTAEQDNDFTEEDVRSMIIEQMKLMAARGGNKY